MPWPVAEATFSPEAWTIIGALAATVTTMGGAAFRYLMGEISKRDAKIAKLEERLDAGADRQNDLAKTADRMLNRFLDREEANSRGGSS